jgi:Protein of unknown function (DUF3631)
MIPNCDGSRNGITPELRAIFEREDRKQQEEAGRRKPEPTDRRVRRVGRVEKESEGGEAVLSAVSGPLADVYGFFSKYLVLPKPVLLVTCTWVLASWLADEWDRFPHLGITSPDGRCAKTRFLELLELVCRKAEIVLSTSPASLFRGITADRPTLLLDEAQCLDRGGSESSQVLYELFCGSIGKTAFIKRCVPPNWEPHRFPTYCPKVVAKVGPLRGLLADRCLPVRMRRKTEDEHTEPFRWKVVEEEARKLHARLETWSVKVAPLVRMTYAYVTPLPVANDRLAELLLPLQAVLAVLKDGAALKTLERYARGLEEGRDEDSQSDGLRLLEACREVFGERFPDPSPEDWLLTLDLICLLAGREEEPWATYSRGKTMTPKALADLLRPFGVRSRRDRTQTGRGYLAADFEDAWRRYLRPLSIDPSNPSNPSTTEKEGDHDGR